MDENGSATLPDTDYYGLRLAEINDSQSVVATCDISNTQGAKLLAKGESLSRPKAEIIVKHKLSKPLEHCIEIENSLDAEGLHKLFNQFMGTLPGLTNLKDKPPVQQTLKRLCLRYEHFPLVRQKVTVLQLQMPEVYYHCIYSCVASIGIALELELNETDQEILFFSALLHDTGYLHLHPDQLKDDLETEDPNNPAVRVHTKIGKIFVASVPGLPNGVGEVVEDHHERTDGTGFPNQKFGKDLSGLSQIIAMTDFLSHNYRKLEIYGEYAHQLVLLNLQLNDNVHFQHIYRAAAKLIQENDSPYSAPTSVPMAEEVLQQFERMQQLFDAEKKLALVLMKNLNSKVIRSIASMLGRISTSFVRSGLAQEEYKQWLVELTQKHDPSENTALLRSHILQSEIEEQLVRLRSLQGKALGLFPDDQKEMKDSVSATFEQIKTL